VGLSSVVVARVCVQLSFVCVLVRRCFLVGFLLRALVVFFVAAVYLYFLYQFNHGLVCFLWSLSHHEAFCVDISRFAAGDVL
jgi:hypothetical protein